MLTKVLRCDSGTARCGCGFVARCRGIVYHKCHAKPGLGDLVASGLAAVGITPARVSAMLGRPCGCERRKAALNRMMPDVSRPWRRPASSR